MVARALQYEKCQEIYFLGDIVYPDGLTGAQDPNLERYFYRYYRPLIKANPKLKIHIVLGNHDYHLNADAWIEISKADPNIHAPARYYFTRNDRACFVVMDTNVYRYERQSTERSQQERWLRNLLPELSSCPTKILLGHHPYRSPGLNHKDATGELKKIYEELAPHFDYFFHGHEHVIRHMGTLSKAQVVISGAGGARSRTEEPGYATLEWDKGSLRPVLTLKRITREGKVRSETYPK